MKNKSPYGSSPARGRPEFPRGLALAFMAVAALVSIAGCSRQADDPPQAAAAPARDVSLTAAQRANIHLYTVAPSSFRTTIETTGAVDFDNDRATSVLAPFSGPVARLLVSTGAHVRKGDALAVVDSPDFAAAVGNYRKALATARTARRLADLDQDLIRHQGISRREAEQAQTDAANAEADRDAALQSLVSLNVAPQLIKDIQAGRPIPRIEATIRAPIAGTVVEKLIAPGQLLTAGTTPCFTVADLSRVWVMAQLFGPDLAAVKVGDPAEVETGIAAQRFSGTVDNISALVDPNTRAVAVRVAVANPGDLLKKQMYVRVLIHSRRDRSGLLVPVSAIMRDDENLPFVYVAQADGRYARRRVTLGDRVGHRYDVSAGLRAGDRIVVEGAIFLQFMQSQ
ncbi:solvent efflux pump periplasmic linker SrpA precursor [mine drainage metagenome]|uniref:Solvent efflux pump periplasmic linker SrpA n=1 Tax=mine drainage metagenome TaxID=410659 RepID=A0A1J5PNW6_9ZZZZ